MIMKDVKGNQLQVGDKVRFWGAGGGGCPNPLDLIKAGQDPTTAFRAYGTITHINLIGDRYVADIQVGQSKRRWHRTSDCILKR